MFLTLSTYDGAAASLFQYFSLVALTDSLCLMEYGFKYKIEEPVNQIFPKKRERFMFYFRPTL